MSEQTQKTTSLALLVVLTLIWGTSFILMKRGLEVFSAGEVGAIRVVSASLFLLPFALTRVGNLSFTQLAKLFFSGLMGIFFPAFLFATAQTRMDSAVTGILNSLTPMFTLLIGVIIFHQTFRVKSLVGIFIGLAGTVLLIISRANGVISLPNAYALFVILACICYGINVNFIKLKIADLDSITITSVSLLLIFPLALTYLFAFSDFTTKVQHTSGGWSAFGYVTLLGVMSTSLATILFNRLIKLSTPLFASSITYLIPIVAVFWGLADHESLAIGHFIGMIAIIAGVYLANKK